MLNIRTFFRNAIAWSTMKAIATSYTLFLLATPAQAQTQSPSYYINYRGVPINCTAANGVPVAFHFDYYGAQLARSYGGGFATYDRTGPKIALDLNYLNSMHPLAAFLIVYHECAHLALPMGVGLASPYQERNADCYAIRAMRNHGLINNWNDFRYAISSVPMRHPLDQQRLTGMANCISWG